MKKDDFVVKNPCIVAFAPFLSFLFIASLMSACYTIGHLSRHFIYIRDDASGMNAVNDTTIS